ncbi:hypothetical protein [Nocardia arizonensis]|uniref:hypothetical protein n=1 Tax=Nocardia arizonensis TaxID=1141647 RepID=UPI0006D2BED2|nr:hypothetical protein [Nocardia arizonensis]
MSDPSVEDEMRNEMRQFSAAMRAAMAQHAQAANWLDRRKARKEISRLIRAEQREQDMLRRHQLAYTNQAVDRYRVYANTVAQRANDPRVDHTRRAADAAGLREQRDRLAATFVTNGHLTPVERGIALDGLDAATVFPEFETGNLFAGASRVKGTEALRYRALVAREVAAVRERSGLGAEQRRAAAPRRVEQTPREQVEDALWAKARAQRDEQARLDRIEASAPEPNRYRATVASTDRTGVTSSKSESFGTEYAATRWMRSDPEQMLSLGDRVHVQTWDSHDATAPLYSHSGRQRAVMASLTGREQALARETLRQDAERPPREPDTARMQIEVDRDARPAAQVAAERDSLKKRLDLSIEHNGELTDRNADLTRRLTATTAQRDQQAAQLRDARAERDRLRAERDEAVRKLAERTPAAQRYGSPERQAAAATDTARNSNETVRTPQQRAEKQQADRDAQEYEDYLGHVVDGEAESEVRRDPVPASSTTAERPDHKQAGWGRGFAEVAADFQSGRNGHNHDHDHGRDRDRDREY